MIIHLHKYTIFLFVLILALSGVAREQAGGIRGVVYDADFEVPLAAGKVMIAETGQTVQTTEEGNYVFGEVEPGTYTLVFSKEGYTRQVKADVVVSPGQMTEVGTSLSGEFTEMEEFIVQDVQIGTGTEEALLELRMESPSLIDSISADLMSQAGASDAAGALKLVAGATVQDGKYAVVRGLPDRYVNSQMNGVRLPTADADKRAVQLDQFPSAIIESIQVTKTFTPDQQGDASGGAVNVVLKGIPNERVFKIGASTGYNTNVKDAGDKFLTYDGGGVSTWGRDDGGRDIQYDKIIPPPPGFPDFQLGSPWDGAVGVSYDDPPTDYKWSLAGGDKFEIDEGIYAGGFGSFFYERDSGYYEDKIDDKYRFKNGEIEPYYTQGTPGDDRGFYTSLLDVDQGQQFVQWGGLGTLGLEIEDHTEFSVLYLYTRDAEDKATLAEDTRGKANLSTFWPELYPPEQWGNYDPYDPTHPGNQADGTVQAQYTRNETLEYTERSTQSWQFKLRHTLIGLELSPTRYFSVFDPEIDAGYSMNKSTLYQPDNRLFSTSWNPANGGTHYQFKPAEVATLGNFQRIWKDIEEQSDQYYINLKVPFEQWNGDEGYMKFGYFNDDTQRQFNQDSFGNTGSPWNPQPSFWDGPWEAFWSRVLAQDPANLIVPNDIDVDYEGEQKISAWYWMIDMPLNSYFNIIGGARYEKTELSITNDPEEDVSWYPSDFGGSVKLDPGDADVDYEQYDVLPSVGFEFEPYETITIRGSYTRTVARQTFKELTPIQQQEYLGGDVFIGNPGLKMSALENYDLRFDYRPYEGGLISLSWFLKKVTDPIEYVQRVGAGFDFTKPVNYPKGRLSGYEIEIRQDLGHFFKSFKGASVGANATFIDSEVSISGLEIQELKNEAGVDLTRRHMSHAPEHLYNFFLTYDMAELGLEGTQFSIFYTVRGDTLIKGPVATNDQFVPAVYETQFGTLNMSLSHQLNETWKLKFSAKNLLDPDIETVYRSKFIGDDVVKTSYRKGREFSLGVTASF